MKQWEYLYIVADRDEVFKINNVIVERQMLTDYLDIVGREGWELTGISSMDQHTNYWRLVFKRERMHGEQNTLPESDIDASALLENSNQRLLYARMLRKLSRNVRRRIQRSASRHSNEHTQGNKTTNVSSMLLADTKKRMLYARILRELSRNMRRRMRKSGLQQ
jgi:hypothetical protein